MSSAELDEMIKALSHPVRREILNWLKQPELHFADQEHPLSFGVCAGKIYPSLPCQPIWQLCNAPA